MYIAGATAIIGFTPIYALFLVKDTILKVSSKKESLLEQIINGRVEQIINERYVDYDVYVKKELDSAITHFKQDITSNWPGNFDLKYYYDIVSLFILNARLNDSDLDVHLNILLVLINLFDRYTSNEHEKDLKNKFEKLYNKVEHEKKLKKLDEIIETYQIMLNYKITKYIKIVNKNIFENSQKGHAEAMKLLERMDNMDNMGNMGENQTEKEKKSYMQNFKDKISSASDVTIEVKDKNENENKNEIQKVMDEINTMTKIEKEKYMDTVSEGINKLNYKGNILYDIGPEHLDLRFIFDSLWLSFHERENQNFLIIKPTIEDKINNLDKSYKDDKDYYISKIKLKELLQLY